MALLTIGTNATTTLSGFQWKADNPTTNAALIAAAVKSQGTVQKPVPGAFAVDGFLYLPTGRGVLRAVPGDWIVIGSTGMPFIMSNRGVVADFTHS